MDFEQTEHDVRMIERQYEQPPDEPYPSGREIVYGEAVNFLKDAIGALEDDNDPEDAIRCAREAIARIHGTL